MHEGPYTACDSQPAVARIRSDLAAVTSVVAACDPGLQALVLTGGFARGEGAVRGGVPQNDYDFVAVRGVRPPRVPYAKIQAALTESLGIDVDLAPVAAWRLRWAAPTIFWYETALRGKVLLGDDVLALIPIRQPQQIDAREGLRLLVNRAAGLLFATQERQAGAVHLQAAKAILAHSDVHLLARGTFAPSQTERRTQWLAAVARGDAGTRQWADWVDWAYRYKTLPDDAPARSPDESWQAARAAVLAAVPVALRRAGYGSLDEYAKRDGLVEQCVWWRRAGIVPGARRLRRHATGEVRVATLRLLAASGPGRVPDGEAVRCLRPVASLRVRERPLVTLQALRAATLQ